MIVLEGPDNAGKTTLAQTMKDLLGWPVIHSGGPKGDTLFSRAENTIRLDSQVILDRVPMISDLIYGQILRGSSLLEKTGHLDRLLKRKDLLIVYCRPASQRLLDFSNHEVKAHEDEDHVLAVKLKAEEIIKAYDGLMSRIAPVIHYNWVFSTAQSLTRLAELSRRVSHD